MTLVEMMIAIAVMSVVIAGIMSAHFLGLREDQLMESKAGANDTSRKAIGRMLNDIRGAKGYDVGTYNGFTNFTPVTSGFFQGPALRLYTAIINSNQAVNVSNYTFYYFDSTYSAQSAGVLWRLTSSSTTPVIVASNLLNPLYFTSETFQGYTQTVRTYKGVIHTVLQFSQFQYPLTPVGSNGLYDYYRIDCRATPHLPDGP